MAYKRQNFTNGQVLKAEHLNNIESGIIALENSGGSGVSPTINVSAITGGHRLTIKDVTGTKTVDVMDGTDGTSVTVSNVNQNSNDNGISVVTFSDGKKLNIKNGSAGTSVTVTKVTQSSADGGSNVITFSDGKTLTVKNGSSGYTPMKGKDYFTAADKAELVEECALLRHSEQTLTDEQKAQARANIGSASVEYVDNKTCIVKNLPSHEYELTVRDGCIVQLGGYIYESATAVCAETPVTPGDVITITGHQWQSSYNYYLYYFYDEDGNVISYEEGDGDNKKSTRTVTVPPNAVRLLVNGIVHSPITVVGEQTTIIDLGYVIDEIEKLKTLPSRKLITLGDSITALGTGDTGWVKYFIEKTGCTLVANTAVNSAILSDKTGTVYDGNPVWNGSDNNVNNVLGNQVQKVINNAYDAPDIIIIAIGTNGGIHITKDQIKAAYYDSNNALIPLENVDRTTNAGAYRWCLDKLHETYPNAIIFWCAPIMGYQATRSAENAMTFSESLRVATEYTGQIMIDTNRCGINGINEFNGSNGEYLADGLHPNAKGAKKIGYYMASKVLPFLDGGFVDG